MGCGTGRCDSGRGRESFLAPSSVRAEACGLGCGAADPRFGLRGPRLCRGACGTYLRALSLAPFGLRDVLRRGAWLLFRFFVRVCYGRSPRRVTCLGAPPHLRLRSSGLRDGSATPAPVATWRAERLGAFLMGIERWRLKRETRGGRGRGRGGGSAAAGCPTKPEARSGMVTKRAARPSAAA